MGLIKEPLDVDFYVEPELLTDREKSIISEYIQEYKTKHKRKKSLTTKTAKCINVRPLHE